MGVHKHRNLFKTERTLKQKVKNGLIKHRRLVTVLVALTVFIIYIALAQATPRADYLIQYGSVG